MSNGPRKCALSVLDLCPILAGGDAASTFRGSIDLAQHAEQLGYRRYWVAEHHSMPGIGSAATSVVIGTLASLYPGRIDLGVGRAPGTDRVTMRVLRGNGESTGEEFPEKLEELRSFLRPPLPTQRARAVPGAGLLGSGGFSAQLAGELGLPFASAGHFSPDNILPGLELYRRSFRPSADLDKPYAMVGINIFAAETDAEAERLATSHLQAHLQLAQGMPIELPPPVKSFAEIWNGRLGDLPFLRSSIIGSPLTVQRKMQALIEATAADELIIHSMIFEHEARRRSYQIVSEVAGLSEVCRPTNAA
jgi:luciferase family oxidoreductase group 1